MAGKSKHAANRMPPGAVRSSPPPKTGMAKVAAQQAWIRKQNAKRTKGN